MRIPQLKVVGECCSCKQSVEVPPGSFCTAASAHKHNGTLCSGSGYSVWNTQFVIQTPEEAHEVALFLKEDRHEVCLSRPRAGHSLSCNDGRQCSETRQKLANALATYYLTLFPEKLGAKAA